MDSKLKISDALSVLFVTLGVSVFLMCLVFSWLVHRMTEPLVALLRLL